MLSKVFWYLQVISNGDIFENEFITHQIDYPSYKIYYNTDDKSELTKNIGNHRH